MLGSVERSVVGAMVSGDMSPSSFSGPSSLGDLGDASTRRLLSNLIITLGHAFADYDFSNTRAEDFTAVPREVFRNTLHQRLSTVVTSPNKGRLADMIMAGIDAVIDPSETQIFAYGAPDVIREDKMSVPAGVADVCRWNVIYFLFNKKQKKIVSLVLWMERARRLSMEEDAMEEDEASADANIGCSASASAEFNACRYHGMEFD